MKKRQNTTANGKNETVSSISNNNDKVIGRVVCGFFGVCLFAIIASVMILTTPTSHAEVSDRYSNTSNVAVMINASCAITSGGGTYSGTVSPGTAQEISGNNINVNCNDSGGYSLYAVGYSNNEYNTTNSTRMLSMTSSDYINTNTSGTSSYWAMKATGSSTAGAVPTIDNGFDNYHTVPSTFTRVSYYDSSTIGTTSNSVTTPTYKVYAALDQTSGTYVGKVKYTLVHPFNVATGTSMQNWSGCSSLGIGDTTFLTDSRDGQVYNVAKLNDGKCWMTTNLNIAGGTELSYTDTDFESTYELPTTNGWTVSDNKLVLPASSTQGFDTDDYAYLFNSGNNTDNCSTPGCYSYYSWDTATLGSGRSITTDNTDAPYSICPKGWHLPNTRTGTNDTADFRKLMVAYGGDATIATYNADTTPTGATMFSRISAEPLGFLRAGSYNSSAFYYGGSGGYCWSATSGNSTGARTLYFYSTGATSANNNYRRNGFAVRCISDN